MASPFPTSPSDGQTFVYAGKTYTYVAAEQAWTITGAPETFLTLDQNLADVADKEAARDNLGVPSERDIALIAMAYGG